MELPGTCALTCHMGLRLCPLYCPLHRPSCPSLELSGGGPRLQICQNASKLWLLVKYRPSPTTTTTSLSYNSGPLYAPAV